MKKSGCKVICGAPTTLVVEGLVMRRKKKGETIFLFLFLLMEWWEFLLGGEVMVTVRNE